MHVSFDHAFLHAQLQEEAAARGLIARLRSTVSAREDDGLDALEALLDAGEATGLLPELREALTGALEPLETALEAPPLQTFVRGARNQMPTLKVEEERFVLTLPPSSPQALAEFTAQLVAQLVFDPERRTTTLAVGLGGTGGCATGKSLPEDVPPGPLFARS